MEETQYRSTPRATGRTRRPAHAIRLGYGYRRPGTYIVSGYLRRSCTYMSPYLRHYPTRSLSSYLRSTTRDAEGARWAPPLLVRRLPVARFSHAGAAGTLTGHKGLVQGRGRCRRSQVAFRGVARDHR